MQPTFYRGAAAMGRFSFGGIVPLIIGLALVALIVYLVIRNKKLKQGAKATPSTPEAILKERLAKGEISEEEYDKLLLKMTN